MFINATEEIDLPSGTVINPLSTRWETKHSVSPTALVDDIIKEHVTSPITGHACESEMSQCLYLCPQCVKKDPEKGAMSLSPHL